MAAHEPDEASPLLSSVPAEAQRDAAQPDNNAQNDSPALSSEDNGAVKPAGESDEAAPEPDTAREQQFEGMPDMRKKMPLVLAAVGIGVYLAAADMTVVAAAYGKIGSELNALNRSSWIATAYFLSLTSFQPLFGKTSDIFGRSEVLRFCYFIFGLGSLWCGLAPNMTQLVLARAVAGIGGGGMTVVVSIILTDLVPLRERGVWQGYINIIYSFGSASGAPLGGILADTIGWRWAFLIQAPMCAVAFLAVALLLDIPRKDDASWRSKLHRIDFPGALTLIAAVSILLVGLDLGSNVSWSAPVTIALLSISVPLFAAFIYIESKVAAEPFAPKHVIFQRSIFAAYMVNFLTTAANLITVFYLPLFWQAVYRYSASASGVMLIPVIVALVIGSIASGFTIKRTGKYYWLTIGAYAFVVLGSAMTFIASGVLFDSLEVILAGLVVGGFGLGVGITSTLIAIISNAAAEDQAIAIACSYLFRSLGLSLSSSITSAIAQSLLRTRLHAALGSGSDANDIARHVRESLQYITKLDPHVQEVVRDTYHGVLEVVFATGVGMAVLSFFGTFFIREKPLSR